jgi:hypothetical protein
MTTKKRIAKKTYKEFMSWLEGVECMQPEDWVPNKTQWKTIRKMVGNLKPEVIERTVNSNSSTQKNVPNENVVSYQNSPNVQMPPQPILQQPPQSTFDPIPQSNVPQQLVPSKLKEVPAAAPGVPPATTTSRDEVLDTSNGNYISEYM